MQLKNATLATLLIILLITRPVESAGGKRKPKNTDDSTELESGFSTLQVGNHVSQLLKKPKKSKKHPSKSRTKQGTSLALVGDPIANSPEGQHFRVVVQRGDMEAARNVFNYGDNSKLRKCCGKYLISLGSDKLVELINGASLFNKYWLLQVIAVYAGKPLLGKVFGALKPSTEQETPSVPMIDPIANNPEGKRFKKAVQIGDIYAMRKVFDHGDDGVRKCYVQYLVNLGNVRFVALIRSTWEVDEQAWLLQIILVHADQSFIESVFTILDPQNYLLVKIAYSAELACVPQSFIYLLNKIGKEDQEQAVKSGVAVLFNKDKTECLVPLVSALSESTLSENVANAAICRAFRSASTYTNDRALIAKRFFDHPAISARDYSDVLYNSYWNGGKIKELFYWLLKGADRQDLKIIKENKSFGLMRPEFQQAVNQAIGIESRHGLRHQKRAEAVGEALEYFPTDLLKLIGTYIE